MGPQRSQHLCKPSQHRPFLEVAKFTSVEEGAKAVYTGFIFYMKLVFVDHG